MEGKKLNVNYGHVLRNAGLNLAGRILPAVVGVIAIPVIIRGLGMERYGILSLALVIVTYFVLFDFGLGDATTKFVAGALGRGDLESLPTLIWTSFAMISVLGFVAGVLMFLAAPLVARDFLKVSPQLQGESVIVFRVMAVAVPFMLLASGVRGTLEAKQRYDLVNAVFIPTSVANYVIPVLSIAFHVGLVPIVAYLVAVRAVTCVAYFFLSIRLFPEVRRRVCIEPSKSRPLLTFGGWLALSNLSWPVLLYMDRLFIGSIVSVAVLPFYTVPSDMVTRLWIIPGSWVSLFPAFSAVADDRHEELAELSARGLKHLALLVGPLAVVCVLLARNILRVWLGDNFAIHSTLVFQIEAIGVFVNSLAFVPDRLLKGIGRVHLIAKLHMAELPVYAVLLYVLVKKWGITGAAVAWSARLLIDAGVLFVIATREVPGSGAAIRRTGGPRVALSLCALAAAMEGTVLLFRGAPLAVAVTGVLLCFIGTSWFRVLDGADRTWILSAVGLRNLV